MPPFPAEQKSQKIVGVVIVAVIAAVLLGSVLPVGVSAIVGDDGVTVTHEENTTETVKEGHLSANATNINTSTDEVELTLTYQDDATEQVTLTGTGDNATVSFDGYDVTATLNSVSSGPQATVHYGYPTSLGWPAAADSIFSSLVYFIILLPLGALAVILIDLF